MQGPEVIQQPLEVAVARGGLMRHIGSERTSPRVAERGVLRLRADHWGARLAESTSRLPIRSATEKASPVSTYRIMLRKRGNQLPSGRNTSTSNVHLPLSFDLATAILMVCPL